MHLRSIIWILKFHVSIFHTHISHNPINNISVLVNYYFCLKYWQQFSKFCKCSTYIDPKSSNKKNIKF